MLAKNNAPCWGVDRGAIHLFPFHGVELLEFGCLPIVPIRQAAELSASEASKTLFLRCTVCRRVERPAQKLDMVIVICQVKFV